MPYTAEQQDRLLSKLKRELGEELDDNQHGIAKWEGRINANLPAYDYKWFNMARNINFPCMNFKIPTKTFGDLMVHISFFRDRIPYSRLALSVCTFAPHFSGGKPDQDKSIKLNASLSKGLGFIGANILFASYRAADHRVPWGRWLGCGRNWNDDQHPWEYMEKAPSDPSSMVKRLMNFLETIQKAADG